MRDNGPINNREVELKDGDMLMSRTDLGGRITFVNKSFIDISGFSEEELLGAPHNLVRHPHMPKEAFADLWAALKAGRPWEGFVKNRTKDGGFYWVRANVSPFLENGKVAGYMSIRTKANRAEIAEAERVYGLFREGRAKGLGLRDGQVIRTTPTARAREIRNSLAGRLGGALGILALLMVAVGWQGWHGLRDVDESLREIYHENVEPSLELVRIADLSQESYRQLAVIAMETLTNDHRRTVAERLTGVEADVAAAAASWRKYSEAVRATWATETNPKHMEEERRLLERFEQADKAYLERGLDPARALARSGDAAALVRHINDAMRPLFNETRAAMEALMEQQTRDASHTFVEADEQAGALAGKVGATLVAALILAGALGVWVMIGVRRSVKAMEKHFDAIATGAEDHQIPNSEIREFDYLHALLRALQAKVHYAVAEKTELDRRSALARREELLDLAGALEGRVRGVVDLIDVSSGSLLGNADTLSTNARQTMDEAGHVSTTTAEVTGSVEAVSAATQELSASVNEISRQVAQAADISVAAVRQAEDTDQKVRGLSEAAQKIGDVVSLINDIASQTNLLALNATIEAARAGDAGKGFAVVASEVKTLANQTAKATEEIGRQVASIQAETRNAVEAISSISSTIGNINELSSAIAAAVEEQGAATSEIARSVEQAARGTASAAASVQVVAGAAEETKLMSDQVHEAAGAMKTAAEQLADEVSGFIRDIRAA